MKKLIAWIRVRFRNTKRCRSFCVTCKYYEQCMWGEKVVCILYGENDMNDSKGISPIEFDYSHWQFGEE